MSDSTMLRLLACCVCLLGLAYGNILTEVSKTQYQVGQLGCELTAELRDCEPVLNSRSTLARSGTVCRDHTGLWQCHSGQWRPFTEGMQYRHETKSLQKIKRRRRKRFFWFFRELFCVWWCPKPAPNKPANKAPTIVCPNVETQRPDFGTSMRVTWPEPVGKDPEQGDLSARRTGPGPNSEFDEGTHNITYYVTDNKGLAASCFVHFKVEAYRCEDLPWPRDGERKCSDRTVSGSTCSVECDGGFEVDGMSSVTCSKGTWSGTLGKCQPIPCGPEPGINNGNLTCPDETVFETFCTLSCAKGFQAQGNLVAMCNEDGEYSQPGTCQDTTAPVFPYGCPVDVTDYAEKQNQPKSVTWPLPTVTDNTGNVTVTSYPANGSLFHPGETTVTLTATDNFGNFAGCKFQITINTLHCPEPDMGDDKLIYHCPDGYGYGYSCSLTCDANFPQSGSSSILCEKDEATFPPTAIWTWPDDSLKPFCKTVSCPDLPAPTNGAIVCDGWTYGLMCVMACNEQYDVPYNVPDLYTCGEQTGAWFPNNIVFGCTVLRRAGEMRLANEFYYYAGSCEDEATRQTIAENFIHILNSHPAFTGICGETVPKCQANFVDVRCGETTNRKRSTHSMIIEFVVNYDLIEEPGESFSEMSSRVEDQLNSFSDVVSVLLDNGELNMVHMGLTVQSDSYYKGYPRYSCEHGVVDDQKGSCRGCPKGTFTDESGDCEDCPVGTYNDVDFASSCTTCDEGLSTKSTGSTSPDNCTDLCPIGSYSSDGVSPCILCDPGTYADTIGSTLCTVCSETQTSFQGAASSSDCVAYDLRIDLGSETVVGEVTSNLTSATLAFWFRADTSAGHTLLMIQSSEENTIVGLSLTDSLSLEVSGDSVDTGARPISSRWQHVTVTLDGSTKEVVVHLMGQEVYRGTEASLGNPVVPDTSSITSTAVTEGGIQLSGINLANRVVSLTEVQSMTESCRFAVEDSVFKFLRSGKILVAPSLCDAVDDCEEAPCGFHPCEDRLDNFHCDCQDGWTGSTCGTPPDFCANQDCQNNALCRSDHTNYTCECQKGFRGDLCQIPIVNGKWSDWTAWTDCSKTCDEGFKKRSRACDSPPPDDDGDNCEGKTEEFVPCSEEKCKECTLLLLSYGNEKTCWEEDNLLRCNVTCRSGKMFTDKSSVLPVYECGAASNYMWNHQVAGGEEARPPPCTEATGAISYSAVVEVTYPDLSCTDGEDNDAEIHNQISDSISYLPCVKDNTCSAEAELESCRQSSSLKKRAIEPTVLTITLTTEMKFDITDDLEAFDRDGTVSDALQSYVEQVLYADMTVQEMRNDSDSFFSLSLNGVVYNIDVDSMTIEASTNCPRGTVPREGICAGCPLGTREHAGSCVLCETGSYQDLPASTKCKPCPQGKTTLDTGSLDIVECSANVFIPEEKGDLVLQIVLPCVIVSVLLVAVAVSYFVWRNYRQRTPRPTSRPSLRRISVQPMETKGSSRVLPPQSRPPPPLPSPPPLPPLSPPPPYMEKLVQPY